jgi:hypothetical protein
MVQHRALIAVLHRAPLFISDKATLLLVRLSGGWLVADVAVLVHIC